MNIKLELPQLTDLKPRLTVIGVGGAGCNALNNMIAAGLTGVEFVAANTDAQTLEASSAEHRIQLGMNLTEGLGAGANPEIGAAAAEEAIDEIKSQLSGSHMCFLAAGMGGGTGTGAISVIARASREMGILTVGVVTKPFQFEGSRRMRMADAGIDELRQHVDTLIVIPNQNLFRVANEKTTFAEAFLLADQVLYSGVACIVDLIVREGLINLDFADVRAVMSNMGTAMMGTGEGTGERRAILAAEEAIANPLLDDVSLQGAKGLLLSITGGPDLTLYEVDEAASRVRKEVDPEANIIVGATFDHTMDEKVRVSIVASGMAGQAMANSFNDRRGFAASGGNRPMSGSDKPAVPPPPMPHPGEVEANSPGPDTAGAMPAEPQSRGTPMPPPVTGANRSATPPPPPRVVPNNTSALWNGPDGVTIEAGIDPSGGGRPRQVPPGPPPPPLPAREGQRFEPRQTEDIHRRARMPKVEDFPPVGQREYYAKHAPDESQAVESQQQKPERSPGFFERWTGIGRRPSDSQGGRDTGKARPVAQHERVDTNRPEAARNERNRQDQYEGESAAEGAELPVFFRGDQGRR